MTFFVDRYSQLGKLVYRAASQLKSNALHDNGAVSSVRRLLKGQNQ